MKPKTGREWQAEISELRKENERLRAEVARLKSGFSQENGPHPLMNCAWCGELMGHGHDCRPEKQP